jgi:transposase
VQHACGEQPKLLARHGLRCSMSRRGNGHDSSPMESFFGSLKNELVHRTTFPTKAAARQALLEHLEIFDNRRRRHSGVGFLTPAEADEHMAKAAWPPTLPGCPLQRVRLNLLDGTVMGCCMPKHRHQEFIAFLNAVERAVPLGKLIHAVLDNHGTHKHPNVVAWLERHPCWTFHFTPTSASWLNAVEGFFSALSRRRLRRGVFRSVADLQEAIARYMRDHNKTSKPFVWTKPADAILAALQRLPVPSE